MNEAIYKAAVAEYTYSQRNAHLGHLPGPILRDLARNESAPREWRKAAVELMLDKGFPEVNHPELLSLLLEVKAHREAKDEVQAIVESAIEAPLEDHAAHALKDLAEQISTVTLPGPFQASFTTQSQTQDEVVG